MKNKIKGVYILLNESKSNDEYLYIKIGKSKDVMHRIKQIEKEMRFTGIQDKLKLFTYIEVEQHTKLERNLHTMLNCWRMKLSKGNEWFKVPEDKLNQRLQMIDLNYYR